MRSNQQYSADLAVGPAPGVAVVQRPEGYQHRVLGNGVHLVGVPMPTPSVCFALYLTYGSVHEPAALSGISHLLEHLFFKGTQRRSGPQLTAATAAIGAETNALTWWLGICCHSRTVRACWEQSLRLIAEQMTRPRFSAESLDAERQVVFQEKARLNWNPRHAVIERLMTASYPGHPLGRPTIGTAQTLCAISLDDVTSYYGRILRPDHLTLVVAGDYPWDEVSDVADEELGRLLPAGLAGPAEPPPPPEPASRTVVEEMTAFRNAHLAYGLRLGSNRVDDYFAAELLATVLGDEARTSAGLWRGIQRRGLVDEVVSSYTAFGDHGILYTYAATPPDRARAAHEAVLDQFSRLGEVSADELARARRKLLSRIAVDGETSHRRALAVARLFTASGRLETLEEIGCQLRAITPEQIGSLVERYRPAQACVSVAIGPIGALGSEMPGRQP
jgi:predicted Zn-dependent peptidase